ncbi:RHS repeat-associated core domain-containing protein [Streptomyces sp. NPDC057271]|uniref:RHS repeat-associated core domain-containing protein n=1 Tax=unclassified Streptomyces TaxID=2593676 RepID=UPI00363730AA
MKRISAYRRGGGRRAAGLVLAMALGAGIAPWSIASAAADEGGGDTPTLTEQAPGGISVSGTSGQVDSKQGVFGQSYPFTLPKGRMGFTPSLGLQYSSTGAVHGGIAAGWTLSAPAIKGDRRAGSLKLANAFGSVPADPKHFRAPDGNELVPVDGLPVITGAKGFRSVHDQSYARYEYLGNIASNPYWWQVLTSDGVTRFYGKKSDHPYTYAPLVAETTKYGDRISYSYVTVDKDGEPPATTDVPLGFQLSRIDYQDPDDNTYASVILQYAAPTYCNSTQDVQGSIPLGSRLDYSLGFGHLTGGGRLDFVSTWRDADGDPAAPKPGEPVWAKVREYALTYDATTECANQSATPFRQLKSVQESATSPNVPVGQPGYMTVKPPVEFTYGKAEAYTRPDQFEAEQPLGAPLPRDGRMGGTKWVDVNGDGLVDVLSQSEGSCQYDVRINRGGGVFDLNPADFAGLDMSFVTADVPVQPGDHYECRGGAGLLWDPSEGAGPGVQPMAWVSNGFQDIDKDGLPDIVAQPRAEVWASSNGPGVITSEHYYASTHDFPKAGQGDNWHWEKGASFSDKDDTFAFKECEGGCQLNPYTQRRWYVYYNQGDGTFNTTPEVRNPTPAGAYVPRAGADVSGQTSTASVSTMDIDGDGHLDFLGDHGDQTTATTPLRRGNQSGDFDSEVTADWRLGYKEFNKQDRVNSPDYFFRAVWTQNASLVDFNGDGLPDQIHEEHRPDFFPRTNLYLNRGDGFGKDGLRDAGLKDTFGEETAYLWRGALSDSPPYGGMEYPADSTTTRRMVDLDYDGLPELVTYQPAGDGIPATYRIYHNGGTGFVLLRAIEGPQVARYFTGVSTDMIAPLYDYAKITTSFARDINGDGLLDLVGDPDRDGNPGVRLAKPVLDTSADYAAPAHLLRTVSNGYGAKTTITYESRPDIGRWVVGKVETDPGQGDKSGTMYTYGKAVKGKDAYARLGFRGFESVQTVNFGDGVAAAQQGAVHTTFGYIESPRGLPTRTVKALGAEAYDPQTEQNVISVADHGYFKRILPRAVRPDGMSLAYSLRTMLPYTTDSYICATADGETTTACVSAAKKLSHKSVVESVYADVAGQQEFVADRVKATESTFTNTQGQQETMRSSVTVQAAWGPAVYRMAMYDTKQERVLDGVTEQTGAQHYRYWDGYGNGGTYEFLKTVTVDDGSGTAATSFIEPYFAGAAIGQVHKVWQAEQYAKDGTGGAYSNATYDGFGINTVRTVNEAGHVVEAVTDLGTGTVLKTTGPNFACEDGSSAGCTFDTAVKAEGTAVSVDGFGRPLTVTRSSVSPVPDVVVSKATYDDAAAYNSGGTALVSTTSETLGAAGQFSHSVSEMDGLGRTVRTVTQQDPHPQQETLYAYDALGGLKSHTSPDPDGTGTVGYTFERDAMGRAVKMSGPNPKWGSGTTTVLAEATYEGLVETVRQRVSDSSPYTEKRMEHDPAGRLGKIGERKAAGTGDAALAFTTYAYDGNGNVAKITDPDGVVTDLVHDWAGNRTQVTSSGKQWSYGYDRNGNLTSLTEPHPAGQTAAYTRTTTYDDLNRPVTETPAVRDLTPEEQTAFKTGVTRHFYDSAHSSLTGADTVQQIGRPSYTTSPVGTTVHRYNHLGNAAGISQTLTETGGLPATTETQHQSIVSTPTGLTHSAQFSSSSGHSGSTVVYAYDQAAQPLSLKTWVNSTNIKVAELTRNAAGLVTERRANANSAQGFASPRIAFDHTTAGQLSVQAVYLNSTTLYRSSFNYAGNGQAENSTETLLNVPTTTTTYTYDHRHQLTGATQISGGVGYNATFGYTDGGRLAEANIGNSTPAVRINPRNVTYTYDPTNPQQLNKLTKPDNTDYATYTYDQAGNTTTRTVGGETITQRWDGHGRLARTTREDGSTETYFYAGAGPDRIAVQHTNPAGDTTQVRRTFGALETIYTPTSDPEYRQHLTLDGTIGRLDGNSTQATLEYYYTNPQGHEALAINATDGRIMRAATYGPYGELLTQQLDPGTAAGKYTREFNGKEYDTHSGLHYYGYRYYDPINLQWTSTDPLYRLAPDRNPTNPRTANLYTYTNNNPIGFIDPDGLAPGGADVSMWDESTWLTFGYFGPSGFNMTKEQRDDRFAGDVEALSIHLGELGLSFVPVAGDLYTLHVTEPGSNAQALAGASYMMVLVGAVIPGPIDNVAFRASKGAILTGDDVGRALRSAPHGTVFEGAYIPRTRQLYLRQQGTMPGHHGGDALLGNPLKTAHKADGSHRHMMGFTATVTDQGTEVCMISNINSSGSWQQYGHSSILWEGEGVVNMSKIPPRARNRQNIMNELQSVSGTPAFQTPRSIQEGLFQDLLEEVGRAKARILLQGR